MRVFPGSFPAPVFDALPLDRYAEAFRLALDHLDAEAEAIREARRAAGR